MLTIPKTEKEIYNLIPGERIMEYYLGIIPQAGMFKSPFREDKNPGCSFWKSPNSGIIYFKDWARGESFSPVQVIMKKYDLNYYRALTKLNLDLEKIKEGYIEGTYDFENRPKLLQTEVKKNFEGHERAYWNKYFISARTLEQYHVSAIKSVWIDKELTWKATRSNPIFSYYFPLSDKIKVYRPLNKDKKGKWLSSCTDKDIIGRDLYVSGKPKHNSLIITSSGKDAMVLHELGFPAIAPIAEGVMIKSEVMEKLQRYYKYIFVFMDSDDTGFKINRQYSDKYPNIKPISIPLHYNCKDISDFICKFKFHKTYKLVKKLLKESVRVRVNNQIPF